MKRIILSKRKNENSAKTNEIKNEIKSDEIGSEIWSETQCYHIENMCEQLQKQGVYLDCLFVEKLLIQHKIINHLFQKIVYDNK